MSLHQPNPSSGGLFAADKHTIETPEQTQLHFAVAGVGSRFLAMMIDTLIQVGLAIVLLISVAILASAGLAQTALFARQWVLVFFIAVAFLIYFGYFAIFEVIWRGQTPGKRAINIRVIKETGRPLTVAETIGRNLLRIVDQLPGFYAVGIAVALLNNQNKRIGDFVAGSIVVRESAFSDVRPVWEHRTTTLPATRLGAEALTAEDLNLIDTFVARRSHLNDDVRYSMARQIAKRIESKIAVGTQHDLSPERLIETAAEERRAMGGY